MNPFQAILFLIFVLPVLMIKELWKILTKGMTKEGKNKLLWYIPYVLVFLLLVLIFVLWINGYR